MLQFTTFKKYFQYYYLKLGLYLASPCRILKSNQCAQDRNIRPFHLDLVPAFCNSAAIFNRSVAFILNMIIKAVNLI